MPNFYDPVTQTAIPDERPVLTWRPEQGGTVQEMADALCHWLDQRGRDAEGHEPDVPVVAHAPDGYVTDHALLTSALAYCLAYEADGIEPDALSALRLAALAHELVTESQAAIRACVGDEAGRLLEDAWRLLAAQGQQLTAALSTDDSLTTFAVQANLLTTDDPRLRLLLTAHLAASGRLYNYQAPGEGTMVKPQRTLAVQADFARHPLNGAGRVALVYGGATKIKNYVFESARLPEVRGASALLDRLNTLDVPALWGRRPLPTAGSETAPDRWQAVRDEYQAVVLSAPECLLYASGGSTLALAPVGVASQMADAIEQLYTTETLTGNSVAVSAAFDLLELHYGCRPQDYWLDQFRRDKAVPERRALLESYYSSPARPDGDLTEADFIARKGFGELVTALVVQANHRRAGWGDEAPARLRRYLPYYELFPQTIKCHSCDLRPAAFTINQDEAQTNQTPKLFCEACARKRITGQRAKRDDASAGWFKRHSTWRPHGVSSWEKIFRKFLKPQQGMNQSYYQKLDKAGEGPACCKSAQDVQEIGAASNGYIGYIYADGNDVGALVARISTPAAYRQFGQRLYQASQAAVLTALGCHLQAVKVVREKQGQMWIHPFEIITIGGDDFIIVVPAKHALDIAATIAHELEKRLVGPTDHTSPPKQERYNPLTPLESDVWTETQRPVISLSAGVVIAHDHTPISYVSELAGQLQKSAKRARKAQHYPGGTVDFAALKSSGAVSLPWESYRRQAFNTDGRIHLTARPFTWHELRGLLDTVRGFKEAHFPRSQMYRLQQDLLKKNRLTASLNYLYYLSHLDNEARKVILKHFQCPWHNDMTDVPPWRKVSRTEFETIWADLLEIYDFVEAQREAG